MKYNVILPCGGSGQRAKLGYNKIKFDLGGMPVISKTIACFSHADITKIIIPTTADDIDYLQELTQNSHQNIAVCLGGDTRAQSVANALCLADSDCDFIIIHDGARPFLSAQTLTTAMCDAELFGSAVVITPLIDSLRQLVNGSSYAVNRKDFVAVQTPQIFKKDLIAKAYDLARSTGEEFTDDASLYEKYIGEVHLCVGNIENIKLTTPIDFARFAPNNFVVGNGWDTHQLVEGRKLILGGIEIPHTKGLLGHSDADVLTHAIMDALLSASHNHDIGYHFPDTNEEYKGVSSLLLLQTVQLMLAENGYKINNITAVIMAQKPKLKDYLSAMQAKLCATLNLSDTKLSITATTTEKLGLVGHEEAISVNAFCSLIRISHF